MREILQELLTDTYSRTIKDNQEDFSKVMNMFSKLCVHLLAKNILSQAGIKEIFDFDKNIEDLKEIGE